MKHRKNHRFVAAVAIATSLFTVTACGSSESSSTNTSPVTRVTASVCAGTPQASDTLNPPTRIVSLAPTATETLFALGWGAYVVAVDDQSNYPEATQEIVNKLSGYEPNVEAIAGLKPDLVVISYNPASLKEQLCALGIPVWEGNAVTDLDGVYNQILEMGSLLGADGADAQLVESEKAANELVARMKKDISAATANFDPDGKGTYYYELDNTYYSLTTATFIGSILYDLFGMTSIADGVDSGNKYPQLSAEAIIAADPGVIFLADTKCCQQSAATVSARPGWSELTAVKNDKIVELDDDIASRWGPRVVDLVLAIKSGLMSK